MRSMLSTRSLCRNFVTRIAYPFPCSSPKGSANRQTPLHHSGSHEHSKCGRYRSIVVCFQEQAPEGRSASSQRPVSCHWLHKLCRRAKSELLHDEIEVLVTKLHLAPDATEDAEVVQGNLAVLEKHGIGKSVILREPRLLISQLTEWWEFLDSFGFSEEQFKHMLFQSPATLANANLVTAGQVMLHLKGLGLDDYAVKQLCVYYPQILDMEVSQVDTVVNLMAKHNTGSYGAF